MNEEQLVLRCKAGDNKALKMLYDKYATWMMGISMRYVGDEDISRDLLHDSFLKIFESVDRFEYRGEGALSAWISRIVVNTAIAFLKKDSNFTSLDDGNMGIYEENNREDNDLSIYDVVSDEMIIHFVGRLPSRLRTVFNLFMFEDVSHSEIAVHLGISESASRVRLHRAKTLLAEALQEHIKTLER